MKAADLHNRSALRLLPAGEKVEVALRDLVRPLHKPSPRAARVPSLHGIESVSRGSVENYRTIDVQGAFPQPKGEREFFAVCHASVGFSFGN